MKVRKNTKLSKVLVTITILSCLNILPFTVTAQSITTASQPPQSHAMGNGVNMEDIPLKQYWKIVEGEPFKFTGKVRTYYLAADEVDWDYGPDGKDIAFGTEYTAVGKEFMVSADDRVGSKYHKCLYQQYTDSNYDNMIKRAKEDEYLGFLGPVIRAEVGDIIKVVFKNRCRIPATISPHGVFYDKANEGYDLNDGTPANEKQDDLIQPGDSYTYTWKVPERCGPGPMDGSSVMWVYHSATNLGNNQDFYAGLVGPMAISRKGFGRGNGSPMDVDREIFLMFSVTNENNSPYIADSFADFSTAPPGTPLPPGGTFGPFGASNLMHGINGYMYGNGPLISMKKNERVRWYVMSMGTFFDGHTPHWHGNTLVIKGMRMDVISMISSELLVADMCPENVGIWLFHCHVNDHLDDGMVTRFEVENDQ